MRRILALLVLISIAGGCLVLLSASPTGTQKDKKPKRKKFGSSLKQLKWDPKSNRAIEIAPKDKDSDPAITKDAEQTGDVISLKTSLAVFDLLITDKANRVVTGLKKEDFIVHENGLEQAVGEFAVGDDVNLPRSIVLILDYSVSELAYIRESIAAARILIRQLAPKDQMAIVTDDVELICDYTSDKVRLSRTLDSLLDKVQHGELGLSRNCSALMATLRELIKIDGERSIIIFQTDCDEVFLLRDQEATRDRLLGKQMTSDPVNFGFGDLIDKVEHTRTTIHSVIPGDQLISLGPKETLERGRKMYQQKLNAMRLSAKMAVPPDDSDAFKVFLELRQLEQTGAATIAKRSGGLTAFHSTPKDASEIYDRILSDINNSYTVGYYPTNSARDGKKRTVRIEVRGHAEYTVRGRTYYYAPTE